MKPTDYLNKWLDRIMPYSPGKTIEGAYKLASNENNYGPSPKVIEGLKKKVGEIYRYPYKDVEVAEALAKYSRAKPENIVTANGSDEMIELVIKAFAGTVGSTYPTFVEYPIYSQIHNRPYVYSKLNEDFSFDAKRFIAETRQANILFLCTPNNPTGTVIEIEDIEEVARTGKIVAVDEAYHEFWGKTAAGLVDQYPNVIVLRTCAKAFGLAGLRVGYAIASPEIASAMLKVRAPFSVNYLAQEAVLLALSDVDYMKKTVNKIITDRRAVQERLSKKFRVIPSEANFLLLDVSPMTSKEFYEKMLEQKIVVRPQPKYDGFEGNWARITIGTSEENYLLLDAIERL